MYSTKQITVFRVPRDVGARILANALLAVGATASAGADILTGPTVNPVSGHTYYLLTHDTWTGSQAQAKALGGNLVTINDPAEEEFVLSLRTFGNQELWIGLNDADVEGDWQWVSGEPVEYVHWIEGGWNQSPVNSDDYVHIWYNASGWNDTSDTYPYPFGVVEVVPEPTSMLLLSTGAAVGFCRRFRATRA